ncbi:MAG: PilN domain-containing protein [Alphaproteobacteria bacterium]|nr:PilN domain-containing protein [Alphaproteobacteria bacterium]
MINEVLMWWLQRMRELLPLRLRRAGDRPADALIVDVPAAPVRQLALVMRRRGRETARGLVGLDVAGLDAVRMAAAAVRAPLVLRMPAMALLERPIALPLAAERALGSMLRYEMDRLTPFTAEQVFFSWRVDLRDVVRRQLHLRLLLLPRAALAPVLDALSRSGVAPEWLEAPDAAGAPRTVPLRPPPVPRPGRKVLAVAAAACLGLGAIAMPFIRQAQEAGSLAQRIAALQPQVAQAQALRRKLAAQAPDDDVFAGEQARVGDALQVLAMLTDLLPDGTYLNDLRLRAGQLDLDGVSTNAAQLIPALAASPLIRNAAFAAPVTRIANPPAEVMAIHAELAPWTAR